MKKIMFAAFAVIGFFSASAQSTSSASGLIIGTWKCQDMQAEYPATLQGEKLEAAKKQNDDAVTSLKNTPFIFTKDGKCTIGTQHGTWVMSNDGKTVTYTNESKQKQVAALLEVTADKVVFQMMDHDIKETFTLTK
jgi:hypothetical protein